MYGMIFAKIEFTANKHTITTTTKYYYYYF